MIGLAIMVGGALIFVVSMWRLIAGGAFKGSGPRKVEPERSIVEAAADLVVELFEDNPEQFARREADDKSRPYTVYTHPTGAGFVVVAVHHVPNVALFIEGQRIAMTNRQINRVREMHDSLPTVAAIERFTRRITEGSTLQ